MQRRTARSVQATKTVGKAFDALVKHFAPTGHYFADWCGKRPFSLSVSGAQIMHACAKKNLFHKKSVVISSAVVLA